MKVRLLQRGRRRHRKVRLSCTLLREKIQLFAQRLLAIIAQNQSLPVAVFPATKRYLVWPSNEAKSSMSWFNESGRYQLSSWSIPLSTLSLVEVLDALLHLPEHAADLPRQCPFILLLARSFQGRREKNHLVKIISEYDWILKYYFFQMKLFITSMSTHWDFSSVVASPAKVLKASMIGRYPVQRQMFPSNDFSTSFIVNSDPFSCSRLSKCPWHYFSQSFFISRHQVNTCT